MGLIADEGDCIYVKHTLAGGRTQIKETWMYFLQLHNGAASKENWYGTLAVAEGDRIRISEPQSC